MLESLIINNFQAHRRLVLELEKRVTTIVGNNDRGKSATVRALVWLVLNRPSGVEFLRTGATKPTSVRLLVDGHEVRRLRSVKLNTYQLDRKKYVAFGNDVPPDVSELLNLGRDNFQLQHDPSFWLSESAGEVSRRLNQVIDLGAIDTCLSRLSSEAHRSKTESDLCAERKKQAKEELDATAHVQQMDEELKQIESKQTQLQQVTDELDTLKPLIEETKQLHKTAAQDVPRFQHLQRRFNTWSRISSRRSRLRDLIESDSRLARDCNAAIISHEKAHKEFHTKTKGQKCPSCGKKM